MSVIASITSTTEVGIIENELGLIRVVRNTPGRKVLRRHTERAHRRKLSGIVNQPNLTRIRGLVDDGNLLASARRLSLLMLRLLDKDVVGNGIPGVVNACEEQQQRRRCDAKHGLVRMGASRVC